MSETKKTLSEMRDADTIVDDLVHAATDQERAPLIRELDELNEAIAAAHLAKGHTTEYQRTIGAISQAHRTQNGDITRTKIRMNRGEL